MLLTGKAKEDFLEWLRNRDYKHFEKDKLNIVEERFTNDCELRKKALIIEWFDSVGIIITFDYFDLNKCFYSEISNNSFSTVGTRQECAKNSILKANEIYNSK